MKTHSAVSLLLAKRSARFFFSAALFSALALNASSSQAQVPSKTILKNEIVVDNFAGIPEVLGTRSIGQQISDDGKVILIHNTTDFETKGASSVVAYKDGKFQRLVDQGTIQLPTKIESYSVEAIRLSPNGSLAAISFNRPSYRRNDVAIFDLINPNLSRAIKPENLLTNAINMNGLTNDLENFPFDPSVVYFNGLSIEDLRFSPKGSAIYFVVEYSRYVSFKPLSGHNVRALVRYDIASSKSKVLFSSESGPHLSDYGSTKESFYIDFISDSESYILGMAPKAERLTSGEINISSSLVKINLQTNEWTTLDSSELNSDSQIAFQGLWINVDGSNARYYKYGSSNGNAVSRLVNWTAMSSKVMKCKNNTGLYSGYPNSRTLSISRDGKIITFVDKNLTLTRKNGVAITDIAALTTATNQCSRVGVTKRYIDNYSPSISGDGKTISYIELLSSTNSFANSIKVIKTKDLVALGK